ncbi:MAG: uracil-DNA glycosylase [Chromatiales bacterium]|nr:uracil-DNA glycosylase [Chromatiales bacterium]
MTPEQRYYLDALGVQLYERRDAPPPAAEERAAAPALQVEAVPEPVAHKAPPLQDAVPAWLDDAPPLEEPPFDLDEPEIDENEFAPAAPIEPDIVTLDWPALQQRVSECTQCAELVANRTQTVFGVGNKQADWMVIGEAPGADEDKQGEPFVGRAGQLLNAMLGAIGMKRDEVYIANILKCRPPNNRDPQSGEAAVCEAFLKRQIELVQPTVILVVGRIAAQNLLKVDTPIGKLRGSVHRYGNNIPVVVTYHPAYLLRSPTEKRKAWADLCLARKVLEDR